MKETFTIEEIKAIFFDKGALREPPYRIYQLTSADYRYYYTFDEKGEPSFFPSVTTLLRQTLPTSPFLIQWMMDNGKESTEKRDMAAAYGTFMHMQFEKLAISRKYDFDDVPARLMEFLHTHNLSVSLLDEWLHKIRKDVLSFAQFVKDWTVKPLAVEIGLVHPEYRFAGCIDLPCMMADPKTGEKFTAIVDFKSGRKAFYEEHELQLHLYRSMWEANFPDCPITRLFNFSPKDWRTRPFYNLKDQTESENAKKLPYLLSLAGIEDAKRDNTITVISGVLDLDKGKISDNYATVSLAELVKKKQDGIPPEAAIIPETAPEPQKRPENRFKPAKGTSISPEGKKPAETEIRGNLFSVPVNEPGNEKEQELNSLLMEDVEL